MKKALTLLIAVALALPVVMAGFNWTGPIEGDGAVVGDDDPEICCFFATYPFDLPSYGGRNSDYPEYEYAFTGETLHFNAEVSDTTIYDVENMDVDVRIQWYGAGMTDNPGGIATPTGGPADVTDLVQLYMCSGTGATYDSETGRYVAQFCGDYIVPDNRVGLGFFDVLAEDPMGNTVMEELATSDNPLYENVNNLLANPTITLMASSGLSFSDMVINSYNDADTYPIIISLNTDDDEEGQGIIGDVSIAATNFQGATIPSDIIYASEIRFKMDASGVWTSLSDNAYGMMPTAWTLVGTDISTDGVGWSEQFYFELWFSADHTDTMFNGGDLWLYYAIV